MTMETRLYFRRAYFAHVLGDVRQGLLRHIQGGIQLPHQALTDGNGEEGGGHVTFQQHPVAPQARKIGAWGKWGHESVEDMINVWLMTMRKTYGE